MIHQTAIVDREVILGKNIDIGPYAVIEKGVSVADGVKIGPGSHIKGNTEIGQGTIIGTGVIIGEMPQSIGIKENIGRVVIGKNNVIREYVTIHSSSSVDKVTSIGDNNFFMAFAHIAHDCDIRNNVVLCNGVLMGGHTRIDDWAFLSAYVAVHQFVRIGRCAMVGGLSRVNQDVPPFMMVVGASRVWGLNIVGLKRRGFKVHDIGEIKKAFQVIYRDKLSLKSSLEKLKTAGSPLIKEITNFIEDSPRGVCGPQKSSFFQKIFLDYPYFSMFKIDVYRLFLETKKQSAP